MNNPNISRLVLLRTSLENDYKHTLWFGKPDASDTKSNQTNYFLSRKLGSQFDYTNLTYIRKDNSVKVPAKYDEIVGCNYVMYQNNPNYNANNLNQDKWYYAFVIDIKYISEGVTELILETDVIQTWYFAYTVQPSFIEREHVSDDTIGANTYPEQVELGEFKCNKKTIDSNMQTLYIVCAINDYANSKLEVKGDVYGGVYSGVKYLVYPYSAEGIKAINEHISSYDDDAKANAINSIFLAPKCAISDQEDFNLDGPAEMVRTWGPHEHFNTIEKQYTIDGYTPRNKKLLCFPYNYLLVSNNNGSGAIYHYEKFSTSNCDFAVKSVVTPGCSIRMTPRFYNGMDFNTDEGLNAGKYPICCWNSDAFTNWMTANSVNTVVGVLGGAGTIALGGLAIASGAGALVGASMIAGGVGAIANTIGQVSQASMQPDQVKGNTNCGDVVTGSGHNTFMFFNMSIKEEYARIIDGYFDMFGYKVCRVKRPNTDHRSRYWYTKTIDANIDGNIPNRDIQKIKDAYNNGITFWRNGSEIGNYGLSNGIVNLS